MLMNDDLLSDLIILAIDGQLIRERYRNRPHILSTEFENTLKNHGFFDEEDKIRDEMINLGYFMVYGVGWNVDLDKSGITENYFKSLKRPKNFIELGAKKCYEIDKKLGILDWVGTPMEEMVARKYWESKFGGIK